MKRIIVLQHGNPTRYRGTSLALSVGENVIEDPIYQEAYEASPRLRAHVEEAHVLDQGLLVDLVVAQIRESGVTSVREEIAGLTTEEMRNVVDRVDHAALQAMVAIVNRGGPKQILKQALGLA
jgi:hypothetical protein